MEKNFKLIFTTFYDFCLQKKYEFYLHTRFGDLEICRHMCRFVVEKFCPDKLSGMLSVFTMTAINFLPVFSKFVGILGTMCAGLRGSLFLMLHLGSLIFHGG